MLVPRPGRRSSLKTAEPHRKGPWLSDREPSALSTLNLGVGNSAEYGNRPTEARISTPLLDFDRALQADAAFHDSPAAITRTD